MVAWKQWSVFHSHPPLWWQFQHIIKHLVPKLQVECRQVTSWAHSNPWALGWTLPSGTHAARISTSLDPRQCLNFHSHGGIVCGLLQQSWCNLFQTWVCNEAAADTCELGAPFWGLGFFKGSSPTVLAFWTLEGDNSWQQTSIDCVRTGLKLWWPCVDTTSKFDCHLNWTRGDHKLEDFSVGVEEVVSEEAPLCRFFRVT